VLGLLGGCLGGALAGPLLRAKRNCAKGEKQREDGNPSAEKKGFANRWPGHCVTPRGAPPLTAGQAPNPLAAKGAR
jgi:hypothetical protein